MKSAGAQLLALDKKRRFGADQATLALKLKVHHRNQSKYTRAFTSGVASPGGRPLLVMLLLSSALMQTFRQAFESFTSCHDARSTV